MITIFAAPREFSGMHNLWQKNAIASWTQMEPRPEVFLLGAEKGIAEVAKKNRCKHIPGIARNEYGTPLLSNVFMKIQSKAKTPLICYINADIILAGNFMQAVHRCQESFEQFLLVGKRLDSDIKHRVEFIGEWRKKLWDYALSKGHYHSPSGIDYFVFTKGLYQNVPPFAIGRSAWDNWLVLDVTRRKIPTIDASPLIRAVHQGKSKRRALPRIEWKRNQQIWFANGGIKDGGYTTSTLWLLNERSKFHLKKKRSPWR